MNDLLRRQAAIDESTRLHEFAQKERERHQAEQVRSNKATTATYWRVFIAAPGIISLSVTFVGYYLSIENAPRLDLRLLGIAWTYLLVSMLAALFRNAVAPNHATYQTWRLTLLKKAEAEEADRNMVQVAGNVLDKATMQTMEDLPPEAVERIELIKNRAKELKGTMGWLGLAEEVLGSLSLTMLTLGTAVLVYFVYTSIAAI